LNSKTEEENVVSALLEYGEFYRPAKASSSSTQSEAVKKLEETLGGKKKGF